MHIPYVTGKTASFVFSVVPLVKYPIQCSNYLWSKLLSSYAALKNFSIKLSIPVFHSSVPFNHCILLILGNHNWFTAGQG